MQRLLAILDNIATHFLSEMAPVMRWKYLYLDYKVKFRVLLPILTSGCQDYIGTGHLHF